MLGHIRNTIDRLKSLAPVRRRRSPATPHESCAVQPLENRQLLTGNVNASFERGNLTIEGDANDNSITVTAVDAGIQITANGETRVNGSQILVFLADDPVTAINNLQVDMKGGEDTFFMSGPDFDEPFEIFGNADIQTGPGADSAVVAGMKFKKKLNFDMGSSTVGKSDLGAVVANVLGTTTIFGGSGSQQINVGDAAADGRVISTFGKNLKVNLGTSRVSDNTSQLADVLTLDEVNVEASFNVKGAAGSQVVKLRESVVGKNAISNLGDSDDVLGIGTGGDVAIRGNLVAKLGAGSDVAIIGGIATVEPATVFINGNVKIDTGSTPDTVVDLANPFSSETVFLARARFGKSVSIKSGDGAQMVGISGSLAEKNMSIKLGDGDDRLEIYGAPEVGGRFRADGGSGLNTAEVGLFSDLELTNF